MSHLYLCLGNGVGPDTTCGPVMLARALARTPAPPVEEAMRLHLAMSDRTGWGGPQKLVESMRVYGALAHQGQRGAMCVPQLAAARAEMVQGWNGPAPTMTHVHLADAYPQHHGWAQRGTHDEGLRLRILLSYWYYKDIDLDALFAKYFTPPYPDVFADSGAYSAYSLGGSVDVAAYAAWLHRWRHLFTAYANLDVKGDVAAGLRNQAYLEARGLTPVPVFHGGEPMSVLRDLSADYPYIALGGIAGSATQGNVPAMMRWLVHVFRLAQGKSVFHGFGMTNWTILKSLPWYSVDSSSWGSGFRYGTVNVFDARRGRFVKLTLGDRAAWFAQADLIRSYRLDPGDFADRVRYDRTKMCALAAISYLRAEAWLRRRHGEIALPQRPGAPVGVRAHLADANPARFAEAAAEMARLGGRGEPDAGTAAATTTIPPPTGARVHLADTSTGVNYRDAAAGLKTYLVDERPGRADNYSRLAHDALRAAAQAHAQVDDA